jgi:hypothetical protein
VYYQYVGVMRYTVGSFTGVVYDGNLLSESCEIPKSNRIFVEQARSLGKALHQDCVTWHQRYRILVLDSKAMHSELKAFIGLLRCDSTDTS